MKNPVAGIAGLVFGAVALIAYPGGSSAALPSCPSICVQPVALGMTLSAAPRSSSATAASACG